MPAGWVQLHVVEADGYAALVRQAAADLALQSAMADELTTRAMALIAEHGGGRYPVDGSQVHDAAAAFTAGPAFPLLFALANRAVHAWLFDESGAGGDQWAVDVAPMLADPAIRLPLRRYNVAVPAKLTVPLTVSVPRQGRLSGLTRWGSWLSLGSAALCGAGALLTLAAARRRGKALSGLGVSERPGGPAWRRPAATSTTRSTTPPATSAASPR